MRQNCLCQVLYYVKSIPRQFIYKHKWILFLNLQKSELMQWTLKKKQSIPLKITKMANLMLGHKAINICWKWNFQTPMPRKWINLDRINEDMPKHFGLIL